jgi:hypothetical protein
MTTSRRDFAKQLAVLPLAAACPPFAQHLSTEERARLEKNIADAEPSLERLRSFPLTNADAPDFL